MSLASVGYLSLDIYHMATIVRALWLVERALFSCNDRALWNFAPLNGSFELWVKRKQQRRWAKTTKTMDKVNYIFNTELKEKLAYVYFFSTWWAKKKAVACASGCGKLLLVFLLYRTKKGHIINNLLTSPVRSLPGNLRPQPWCIDLAIARSIHQGLSLRFPCNDLTLG